MQREIKFRARIKENGKPILFYQNDQYLISFLRRVTSFIMWEKNEEGTVDAFNGGRHESYLPNPIESYLDQYTGLKDKNGKEIYEGDIVRLSKHMDPNIFQEALLVEWNDKNKTYDGIYPTLEPWSVHEVIGNIHESPDLLN